MILLKIKVDNCNNPKSCIKCVQACPAKIFILKPIGTKKLSDHVEKWRITTIFKDLCNGCMKCIEVCPENCIKIEV